MSLNKQQSRSIGVAARNLAETTVCYNVRAIFQTKVLTMIDCSTSAHAYMAESNKALHLKLSGPCLYIRPCVYLKNGLSMQDKVNYSRWNIDVKQRTTLKIWSYMVSVSIVSKLKYWINAKFFINASLQDILYKLNVW